MDVPLEFGYEPEKDTPIRVYGMYREALFKKQGMMISQRQENGNVNGSLPRFYYPTSIQVEHGMSGSIVLTADQDTILGVVSFKMPGGLGTGIASGDVLGAFLEVVIQEEKGH